MFNQQPRKQTFRINSICVYSAHFSSLQVTIREPEITIYITGLHVALFSWQLHYSIPKHVLCEIL